MIGKLTGRFGGTADGVTLVEVGGVGYVVRTPGQAGTPIAAREGAEISLFIHTAVREDAIDLYGFPTGDELRFFKQLMSVSGIGPKTALGVMSVADTATLKQAMVVNTVSLDAVFIFRPLLFSVQNDIRTVEAEQRLTVRAEQRLTLNT